MTLPDPVLLLSTDMSIAAFVVRAIEDVPGVRQAHASIRGALYPDDRAPEFLSGRFAAAPSGDAFSTRSEETETALGAEIIFLTTMERIFGFVRLDLGDRAAFAPYRAFFEGILSSVASQLFLRDCETGLGAPCSELEARIAKLSEQIGRINAELAVRKQVQEALSNAAKHASPSLGSAA
jgi:hypothetical protein